MMTQEKKFCDKIAGADKGNLGKVLIFPALIKSDPEIYFLFTLYQIADIIKTVRIRAIPFSSGKLKGITLWKGDLVSVISLEASMGFGMEMANEKKGKRKIVVRTADENKMVMMDVHPATHIITTPITSPVTNFPDWLPDRELIRGIFRWAGGFIIIPHMENILKSI